MRRILYALPFVALLGIAAVGPMTTTTANSIAVVIMLVAPFVLKFIKLDSAKMVIVSYVVALATAVGAGFLSGDLTSASFSVANLAATSTALWGVMQVVYQLFKDNKTFGAALR